jgi:pSer/pThr/pTyr-binding forkhead associated (FHA) protein
MGYKLVDLESRNGTLVNGSPINQHILKPGDVIRIGATEIVFEDDAALLPEEPISSAAAAPAAAAPQRRPPSELRRAPTELRGIAAGRVLASRRRESSALVVAAIVAILIVGGWLVFTIISSFLPSSSRAQWEQNLQMAREFKTVDPERARTLARSIPLEAGALYEDAQELIREIERAAHSDGAAVSQEMLGEYEELRRLATTTNFWDQILEKCDAFERKWGDAVLPGMKQEIRGWRAHARRGKGESLTVDLGLLEQSVQQSLSANPPRFAEAVAAYEEKRRLFADSQRLLEQADRILSHILEEADRYFAEQEGRAVELLGSDAAAARAIYDRMLSAFGRNPNDPYFGVKVRRIQASLAQIEAPSPPPESP